MNICILIFISPGKPALDGYMDEDPILLQQKLKKQYKKLKNTVNKQLKRELPKINDLYTPNKDGGFNEQDELLQEEARI